MKTVTRRDLYLGLIEDLANAPTFTVAARALMKAAKLLLERVFQDLRIFGRIGRMMLHLRPDGGPYARSKMHDFGGGATDLAHSTSVWRAMQADPTTMLMAVESGRLYAFGRSDQEERTVAFGPTRRALGERAITHLHAVPLLGPPGRLNGMLSIEVRYTDPEVDLIGDDAADHLLAAASIAAPYLERLPDEALQSDAIDEDVPVVSPPLRTVLGVLTDAARHASSVVLIGPPGRDAAALARWCHRRSDRADARLIHRVVTADTADSVNAWLTAAAGSSLYIEGIERLDSVGQRALAIALERPQPARRAARLFMSADSDWATMVANGRFDEALFRRLYVVPVEVPPLRRRKAEIPIRARRIAERFSAVLSDDALPLLQAFDWPGDHRQLANVIERAAARATGERSIGADHVRGALASERWSGLPKDATERRLLDGVAAAISLARGLVESGRGFDTPKARDLFGLMVQEAWLAEGDYRKAVMALGMPDPKAQRNMGRNQTRHEEQAIRFASAFGLSDLAWRIAIRSQNRKKLITNDRGDAMND